MDPYDYDDDNPYEHGWGGGDPDEGYRDDPDSYVNDVFGDDFSGDGDYAGYKGNDDEGSW